MVAIDLAGPDNATVITSYAASDRWTFTTVYGNEFRRLASDYQFANNVSEETATTQTLMDIFNGAINLYKAPTGTTTYALAGIDQNGKLIIVPCPQ
ncbi:MAG: hypothetical protein V4456_03400 [Bacteroidota bacterium]